MMIETIDEVEDMIEPTEIKRVSCIDKQILINNILEVVENIDDRLTLSLTRELYSSQEVFDLLLDMRNTLLSDPYN